MQLARQCLSRSHNHNCSGGLEHLAQFAFCPRDARVAGSPCSDEERLPI